MKILTTNHTNTHELLILTFPLFVANRGLRFKFVVNEFVVNN